MKERTVFEMFGSLELAQIVRITVCAVVEESKTRAEAASKLGISRYTLQRRLKRYRTRRDPDVLRVSGNDAPAGLRTGLEAEGAARERFIQTSAPEDPGVAIDPSDD